MMYSPEGLKYGAHDIESKRVTFRTSEPSIFIV